MQFGVGGFIVEGIPFFSDPKGQLSVAERRRNQLEQLAKMDRVKKLQYKVATLKKNHEGVRFPLLGLSTFFILSRFVAVTISMHHQPLCFHSMNAKEKN